MVHVGLDKTFLFLDALKVVACDAIKVAKHGIGIGVVGTLWEMASEVKVMVSDAKEVLPELSDLDASESARLGAYAFAAIKEILVAIAA